MLRGGHKGPDVRTQGGRSWSRLIAPVLLVSWTACLVPGPIEEQGFQNQPLEIHLESIQPSSENTIHLSRSDGPIVLSVPEGIAVIDPENEPLEYVWYLNYNPLLPSFESVFEDFYNLDPCAQPVFIQQDHFNLTVIVSDRPLKLTADLRTFPEDASTFAIDWDIYLYGSCP